MLRLILCLCHFLVFSGLAAQMCQQAYVWQRVWTPQLKSAIEAQHDEVAGLTVLYGEYLPDAGVGYFPANIHFDVLKSSGVPVALALRLNWNSSSGVEGAFNSGFSSFLRPAIDDARKHGLEPAALEIDFDCPTSQLEFYAAELRKLRPKLDGIPLSITTLPTWMNRPAAFGKLVAEVDRFVLQVHSIKRPDHFESQVSLCDLEDSLRWCRQAAAYGKPYHVALPTYGYRLAYDESGELVEVAAENASSVETPGWRYRVIRAEPESMAELVRELEAERPENCLGVIWYRLPIGGERLNWDPLTWQAVKRGQSGSQSWEVEAVPEADGLIRLEILQESETALCPPENVSVLWEEASPLAWDGQRNYTVTQEAKRQLSWQWPANMEAPLLPQGTRWTIGWLRLDAAAELKFDILNNDE